MLLKIWSEEHQGELLSQSGTRYKTSPKLKAVHPPAGEHEGKRQLCNDLEEGKHELRYAWL